MELRNEVTDNFITCRFPSLIKSVQQSQSRATSYSTQPVDLPNIKLLLDFSTAHNISHETFFSTVWALVLRCYVGVDAVSFGRVTAHDFFVHRVELAGARNFMDLAQRCRAVAVQTCNLGMLVEYDTLVSADKSYLSPVLKNGSVSF